MSDEPPKKDFTLLTDLPLMDPPAQEDAVAQDPSPANDHFAVQEDPPAHEDLPTFDEVSPAENAPVFETSAPLGESIDVAEFAVAAPELAPPTPSFEATPDTAATSDLDRTVAADPVELSSQDAWNLSISGLLRPEQRARLTDIVTREAIGIREVDLEPQFDAGRIFIPRISEYLGIVLIQALRDASVEIHFEPADHEMEREAEGAFSTPSPLATHTSQSERAFTFDQVLLSADSALPGVPSSQISVIDVIIVTATLTHAEVESRFDSLSAHVFEDRMESLKRELKARAYYRGAHAVLDFGLELQPLKDPALYKLMLTGTAVKLTAATAGADARPPELG